MTKSAPVGIYVIVSIILLGGFTLAYAETADEMRYLNSIAEQHKVCTQRYTGADLVKCHINVTPQKCRPYMIAVLSSENKENLITAGNTLRSCLNSCSASSIWSRMYGECSIRVD